jgi:hypothetical protein
MWSISRRTSLISGSRMSTARHPPGVVDVFDVPGQAHQLDLAEGAAVGRSGRERGTHHLRRRAEPRPSESASAIVAIWA